MKIIDIVNKLIFLINSIFLIGLLLSYVAQFLSPVYFWPISFLGLLFPILFIVNFIFLIYWSTQMKKQLWAKTFILHQMPSHEYKCEVNEVHHIQKIDSPSGTALVLKEDIQKIYGQNINVNSKRLNKTVGIHNIKYESDIDEIIITHNSKNRDGFALGAILAAEWIVGKTGFFTMKDVLKF